MKATLICVKSYVIFATARLIFFLKKAPLIFSIVTSPQNFSILFCSVFVAGQFITHHFRKLKDKIETTGKVYWNYFTFICVYRWELLRKTAVQRSTTEDFQKWKRLRTAKENLKIWPGDRRNSSFPVSIISWLLRIM